jgi:hypothetical protein
VLERLPGLVGAGGVGNGFCNRCNGDELAEAVNVIGAAVYFWFSDLGCDFRATVLDGLAGLGGRAVD